MQELGMCFFNKGILVWDLFSGGLLMPLLRFKLATKILYGVVLLDGIAGKRIYNELNWTEFMMNYFWGMVDRQKTFSLISSRDHCQTSSPSRISNTPRRIWTCTEPEFKLCWMKLCGSYNHQKRRKWTKFKKSMKTFFN